MLAVLLRFLKNWTLPLAMLAGGIGYPVFIHLSFLTPYLIFTMLLLTFCKVPFGDLRFKPVHFWLLLVQIGGAVLVYLLLKPLNIFAAEGAFICVIAPTATAASRHHGQTRRKCRQPDKLYTFGGMSEPP